MIPIEAGFIPYCGEWPPWDATGTRLTDTYCSKQTVVLNLNRINVDSLSRLPTKCGGLVLINMRSPAVIVCSQHLKEWGFDL